MKKRVKTKTLALFFLAPWLNAPSLFAGSYDETDVNNKIIIAANWQQHSGEYTAYFYQSFNGATDQLANFLANTPKGKQLAIITDIDDTLIPTTPYISTPGDSTTTSGIRQSTPWRHYQKAKSLPGSVEFLQKASLLGVEIFYISEQLNDLKSATINQLRELGYPVSSANHVIVQEDNHPLLSKEDKRQRIIDMGYYPIMLFGDQLDDLGEVDKGLMITERKQWVSQHQEKFGRQWFILPNALNGFREEAITGDYPPRSSEQPQSVSTQPSYFTGLNFPVSENYQQQISTADHWIRKSADFSATALQTYNLANKALEAPENRCAGERAIVVDIDGTLIGYPPTHLSPPLCKSFQSPEEKMRYYEEQFTTPPIPGAREFLHKADALGYEIFYLTAREHSSGRPGHPGDIENYTLQQLVYNQFPKVTREKLLNRSKYCPDNKTKCGKQHQRTAITSGKINGKNYNVRLFVGDLLDDFDLREQGLSPFDKTSAEQTREFYGRKYFIIPNPVNKTWMWHYYSKVAGQDICQMSEQERSDIRKTLINNDG